MSSLIVWLAACAFGCSRPAVGRGDAETARPLPHAVNINTATADELQRIPHIGEKLAARIVEHRNARGPFRRPEELMLIQGISDERFRKIRPLLKVE